MSGFKDHFSAGASRYAAHRPVYPAALAEWLASLCESRTSAWDVGCGTGQLSVLLADRFERVIATDASAQQVARAAAHPRVEYWVAPAERSGLPESSVDLIAAAQAAHWFDLPVFYGEVRRAAKRGAAVALVCYGRCMVDDGGPIDGAVEAIYSGLLAPYWPPERRHVETGYADMPFPFEELPPSTLPGLEMTAEWERGQLAAYIGTWSAVGVAERAGVRNVVERLTAELADVWPEGEKNVVRWPLSLRVGRVER
ncbi:MAG TPA: class I SAM-dependent methyltransferase [Phycisphaerales bacterium]|nr:class I SAM-dependent methyltransferase [Phycisphaerales bacterium]